MVYCLNVRASPKFYGFVSSCRVSWSLIQKLFHPESNLLLIMYMGKASNSVFMVMLGRMDFQYLCRISEVRFTMKKLLIFASNLLNSGFSLLTQLNVVGHLHVKFDLDHSSMKLVMHSCLLIGLVGNH